MNPIFIEYYSHEGCDCYKINLPWPKFAQEKIVLCRVDQGLDWAKTIATGVIVEHLEIAISRELTVEED